MKWLSKVKGDGTARPPRPELRSVALAAVGGFTVIGTLALLTSGVGMPLLLGSFGASCVLVFGFPDAPFSQPRHLVGGHFLSSLIGLLTLQATGPSWWGMALAASLALAAMMVARIVHPPAGSNPVIIFLMSPDWSFLVSPTLAGSIIILAIALLYNNLTRRTGYPKYW